MIVQNHLFRINKVVDGSAALINMIRYLLFSARGLLYVDDLCICFCLKNLIATVSEALHIYGNN